MGKKASAGVAQTPALVEKGGEDSVVLYRDWEYCAVRPAHDRSTLNRRLPVDGLFLVRNGRVQKRSLRTMVFYDVGRPSIGDESTSSMPR